MHKIALTKEAEKEYAYLYKADRVLFKRIRTALHVIAKDPAQGKPLKFSLKGRWSYRVGMYRIIYTVAHNILTVHILDIGHRREIYR